MTIKSFIAARNRNSINKSQPLQVKDYMTRKLITFKPSQGISIVMNTLLKQRITGGPVVNDDNQLVGIISDTDLMHVIGDSRYHNLPLGNRTVAEYMTDQVITIELDTNIFDAATKFLKTGHRRFPVTQNGKLVGQISRMDVIIAATKLKGDHWRD